LQSIVFGEKIKTERLVILQSNVLAFYQRYVPEIDSQAVQVIIDRVDEKEDLDFESALTHLKKYFDTEGAWYPETEEIKKTLLNKYANEIANLPFGSRSIMKELNEQ